MKKEKKQINKKENNQINKKENNQINKTNKGLKNPKIKRIVTASSDPKMLDYSSNEYYRFEMSKNYISQKITFDYSASVNIPSKLCIEEGKEINKQISLFIKTIIGLKFIIWTLEPLDAQTFFQNARIDSKKLDTLRLIMFIAIEPNKEININEILKFWGEIAKIEKNPKFDINQLLAYTPVFNHLKKHYYKNLEEIWGYYPKLPEIDIKLAKLITGLEKIDFENEQANFNFEIKIVEAGENSFIGQNALYNKIKQVLSKQEQDLIKKLSKDNKTNAFEVLSHFFLPTFKKVWTNGWLQQFKNRVKDNTYMANETLSKFQLTQEQVIDYITYLFKKQNKQIPLLTKMQTRFIISAREFYLSNVARYLGEEHATPLAKQAQVYSKYLLLLYHQVFLDFEKQLKKINKTPKFKIFDPTVIYNIGKYFNATPLIPCELVGYPVLAYFDDHFKDYITRETSTTKNEDNKFKHGQFYVVKTKNNIFENLSKEDLKTIAQERFKTMPRVSPPIQWLRETDILNDNYTGGYNINKKTPTVPFLHIQNWEHKHQLQIYNPRILEAVNMAQTCGFRLNTDQFNWFFSHQNPTFISEGDFKIAQEKIQQAISQQRDIAKVKKELHQTITVLQKQFKELADKSPIKENQIMTEIAVINKRLENEYYSKNAIDLGVQLAETISENQEKCSLYYSQRKLYQDFSSLLEQYITLCKKINENNEIFPFPQIPIIYFPTGIDFRGRHASRSGTHHTNNSDVKNTLESPWLYPLDELSFIHSLVTRYVPRALSLNDSIHFYNKSFGKILLQREINDFVKTSSNPIAFHAAIIENQKLLQYKKQKSTDIYLTRFLIHVDATASAVQLQNMLIGNSFYKRDLNLQDISSSETPGSVYQTLFMNYLSYLKSKVERLSTQEQDQIQLEHDRIVSTIKKNLPIKFIVRYDCNEDSLEHTEIEELTKVEKTSVILVSYNYFIFYCYNELKKMQVNQQKFLNFLLPTAKSVIMQGSYGGTVWGFLQKLKPLFNNSDFLKSPDLVFLRFYFIKHFWDYLLSKTSCFTYLKMCKRIAAVYSKYSLLITFNSLGGYFVTTRYNKMDSLQIYRKIENAQSHRAVLHTLYAPKGKVKHFSAKQATALTANFIQAMDAFIIHRLFSKIREFYIPGLGLPLLSIFDSLTMPTILLPMIISIYQDINYDIFANKGTIQDFQENYSNEFFIKNEKTLLQTYFEHFIADLKRQFSSPLNKEGLEDIKSLENDLNSFIIEMKSSKDFIPFDYEILKSAIFVKKT